MQIGSKTINGVEYYFNSNGQMSEEDLIKGTSLGSKFIPKKLYDSSEIDKIPNRITILESYKGQQLMEIYELQPDTKLHEFLLHENDQK